MTNIASPSTPAPRRRRAGLLIGLGILVALAAAAAIWQRSGQPKVAFVEYPMLEPRDVPTAIAAAPDGSIWFTIDFANAIGRVRDGNLERFVEETTNGEPVGIAAEADSSPGTPTRQPARLHESPRQAS
jgi:virginiamycin B lyase